jgi:alpha-D-xyloside xylohydrolase
MPYIYSLSWKVTDEAYTIMRVLAFDFRTDPSVYDIKDQYMFGPAFLVNPVTEQLCKLTSNAPSERTRKVYLPKSTKWYDFWTGKILAGGQTIDAPAPIETMPLYVRSGSIVPMGPFLQFATEKPADPIELRVYTGADGQFTLYEDENNSYDYEKGEYAIVKFKWNDSKKTLTISGRKGNFSGMLKERIFDVVLVKDNHGTGVEICPRPDKVVKYKGGTIEVKL